VLSATAQLEQRRREQREQQVAEHTRLVAAAHKEHAEAQSKAMQALQNEDAETKAQRAAMLEFGRLAAKAEAKTNEEGPCDKRSRRVKYHKLYTAGVIAFRQREDISHATTTPVPAHSSCAAQVLVRARPLFVHEAERGEWDAVSAVPHGFVVHEAMEKMRKGGMQQILRHHTFSHVRAVCTDDDLYSSVRSLLQRSVEGGMSTLFCYGMTGSGKTYSMNSIHRRLPTDLLSLLAAASLPQDQIQVSCFELVGKRAFDLLPAGYTTNPIEDTEDGGHEPSRPLSEPAQKRQQQQKPEVFLRVDSDGNTKVYGVTEHVAHNPDVLTELLQAAATRRETSATGANCTSSRSHAVYVLSLPGTGRLTLIDLAGSEGNQETLFHTAQHVAEAKEINNSLAALRACLRSRSTDISHAPFRESALTRILKDALTDQNAAVALLACVSPACTHMEHSLHTLRTAVHLTGVTSVRELEHLEDEEVRHQSIERKGPKTWDHETLCGWLSEQTFAEQVKIPSSINGQAIMKLTKPRLASYCDNVEVAAELFDELRVATKEAAKRDLEARQQLFQDKNKQSAGKAEYSGAAGFARNAPANPQVITVM